ncbi:MAG: right-handed parallel beta-helix repeat-containing protein [Methanobacteriota archaeon]
MDPKRTLALGLAVLVAASSLAQSHAERPTEAPARPGAVPDPGRTPTAILDVCLVGGCAYDEIQEAVKAAPNGSLIRIWPGLYLENTSRNATSYGPDTSGHYSYEHHVDFPNSQNLVAVVGKTNITLRGMGDDPEDVAIDVGFEKHIGIRGDRADGLVIQNLAVYHAFDHNVYVLDQDGFWIDNVTSGWGYEYDFLMFAVDHGVLKDCVAFGAGDAGIYPGGTADTPGRHAVEVTGCRSYNNVLGYSGTQGNYIYVHGNDFYENGIGIVSDSETDHPNYPQKGSRFESNKIFDNNFNYLDPGANVTPTVFVGEILLPAGIGLFLASNNENVVEDNDVWGNDAFGVWLASGQGIVLGPTSDPPAPPFVSSGNRFLGNRMYGPGDDNAIDFGWDGLGAGNCWQGNLGTAAGAPVTSDHPALPDCVLGPAVSAPNPLNVFAQASLVYVDDPDGEHHPICYYHGLTPCSGGATDTAAGLHTGRNHPDGYVPIPWRPACGPGTC